MSKRGFIRRRLSKLFMNMLYLLIYIIFKKYQTYRDFQHNWNLKSKIQKGKKCKQKRHDFEAMSILPQLVIKQRKLISVKSLHYLTLYQQESSRKKAFLISPDTNLQSINHRTTRRLLFAFLLVWGEERKLHLCISELFQTIVIYMSISRLLNIIYAIFNPIQWQKFNHR